MIKKVTLLFACLMITLSVHAQELKNHIMVNGKQKQIHHENIVKTVDGKDYALADGKFYEIQKLESFTQGPSYYTYYVTKDNGEKFDISKDFVAHLTEKQKARGVKSLRMKEYPRTKPFVRDTSASGKAYKWFDVIRTKEGRIISRDEFNSYRGNFTYVKLIKGGPYAMDTTIIVPPTDAAIKAREQREKDFANQVGQKAKDFEATDIFGNTYSLEALEGKVIVMNFWFIACPPCIKEMPELNNLVDKYGNRDDIVFLGFATDTEKRLGTFLSESQFKYQVFAKSLDLANKYLVGAYPTSFVIDKKGIVTYAHTGLGETTIKDIEEKIKIALD